MKVTVILKPSHQCYCLYVKSSVGLYNQSKSSFSYLALSMRLFDIDFMPFVVTVDDFPFSGH